MRRCGCPRATRRRGAGNKAPAGGGQDAGVQGQDAGGAARRRRAAGRRGAGTGCRGAARRRAAGGDKTPWVGGKAADGGTPWRRDRMPGVRQGGGRRDAVAQGQDAGVRQGGGQGQNSGGRRDAGVQGQDAGVRQGGGRAGAKQRRAAPVRSGRSPRCICKFLEKSHNFIAKNRGGMVYYYRYEGNEKADLEKNPRGAADAGGARGVCGF